MPLLDDEVRAEVKGEFASLVRGVKLAVFTQEFECSYCAETRSLAEELAELSDKVTVEVHDFLGSKSLADSLKVDKIPAIVVLGDDGKDYGIRFYGIPAGYEFGSLLEAIKLVSAGETGLSPRSKETIRKIEVPVHIQVFVTLTCPYCPLAVQLAHKIAFENERIVADMVEASEFPHLANRYNVYAVPKVVLNDKVEFEGALPEEDFIRYLQEAAKA